jgi:hypothetical protein
MSPTSLLTCCYYSKEWRGGGIKENDGRGEYNYIVRTFVNVTMYLQYSNNIIKKKKQSIFPPRVRFLQVPGATSL